MSVKTNQIKSVIWIAMALLILSCFSGNTPFKLPVSAAQTQAVYYVSWDGSDENPGTEEKPFKTVTKAQTVVRTINKNMTGDIVVYLREGNYNLTDTILFTPADSGTNGYTVHYRAYPNETPVIMAATQVTGWTRYDGNIYRAPLSRTSKLRSLYVNGKRAYMASRTLTCQGSWGEYTVKKDSASWAWDDGANPDGIKYRATDFPVNTRNPEDVESESSTTWNKTIVCFREVSTEGSEVILKLQQPYGAIAQRIDSGAAFQTEAGKSHKVSNVFEFLDTPGEFYFDKTEGYVYYYKEDSEDMSTAVVYAPNGLETLLDIAGNSTEDRVRNLSFYGLTFQYSDWNLMEIDGSHGKANVQGSAVQIAYEQGKYQNGFMRRDDVCPAAISVNNSDSIVFERNTLAHTGAEGISMNNDVKNAKLIGNAIYDIAGSAVVISHPQHVFIGDGGTHEKYAAGIEGSCAHIQVTNNFINETTRLFKGHAAVIAYYPDTLTFSNNLINDTAYNGLSMGWGWWEFDGVERQGAVSPGNPSTTMKNNTVSNNWIFNTMQELYDSGPIYTLGSQPGTVISNNYLRGVPAGHKYGLHPDEGSAFITSENNVIDTDLEVDDTVEVGTWGYQHDLHYRNNYATKGTYHSTDVPDSTFEPLKRYPDAVWPREAFDICVNSGIEEEYQDIIPSEFMGVQDILFPASLKGEGGVSIPIKSTGNEKDTVWFAPSNTVRFQEGFTMTKAGGTDGTIQIPSKEGTYKLYVISEDGTVSQESQAVLIVTPKANRLLPESLLRAKPGEKIELAENLEDESKSIWIAPAQMREGQFDERNPGMSKVPGDSSTVYLPMTEGTYYLYILNAEGTILSRSETYIHISNKYLVRDLVWAYDSAIEDRKGENGSLEINRNFGELQNYDPDTIGWFFDENTKSVGGLTQINALDNRGGGWAGYLNIIIQVPKTDTYEINLLCTGGSGRKLEVTVNGISERIFETISDKSSLNAYSTGDVLNVFQLEVQLKEGENRVKLQAPSNYDAPNFIALACVARIESTIGEIPVDSIRIKADKDVIKVGETLSFTPIILPSYATNREIAWSAEDDTVRIDQNGRVTGVAAGTALIQATAKDGSKASCSKMITIEESVPQREVYTVTLDGNGGTVPMTKVTRQDGEPIGELPTPTLDGFEFTGWYTSPEGGARITAATQVKESFTIYAQWKVKPPRWISPEKGDTFSDSGLKYKVVKKAASGKEGVVQVAASVSRKAVRVSIPAVVQYRTFTFKVESIAKNAFKNHTKLKKLVIGGNVKRIDHNAFMGCKALEKVTLGKKIEKIGKKVFYNNKKLKSITIHSKKLKSIGKNAFKNIHRNATIKVPSAKLQTYKRRLKGTVPEKRVKRIKRKKK